MNAAHQSPGPNPSRNRRRHRFPHGLFLLAAGVFVLVGAGSSARAGAAGTATNPPTSSRVGDGLTFLPGDRTVLVRWRFSEGAGRVRLIRRVGEGEWRSVDGAQPRTGAFLDVDVENHREVQYRVITAGASGMVLGEGRAGGRPFRDEESFLDWIQQTAFDYFWNEANPENGLIKDRNTPDSKCSIAAVGFGLSGIVIGVERGWVPRAVAAERVLRTVRTFRDGPQGEPAEGTIGHRGWFYHFLEMSTGLRAWKCELSSIDTVLFLAGALDARAFFDGADPAEAAIRSAVDAIYARIDWSFFEQGERTLSMGWHPEKGFNRTRWVGYNEAMILYVLGLGAPKNPLPSGSWEAWVRGYEWVNREGYEQVAFSPLFGHQYSHCWIDFRGIADAYMRGRGLDYFENSRRATLAQQAWARRNPLNRPGLGEWVWGWTACDGPGFGPYRAYSARGPFPPEGEDGTLAPTAVGGSVVFAPEICIPTLRHLYSTHRKELLMHYGFRDAFNLEAGWWGPDVLGIDQGPMLIMAENFRTGNPWRRIKGAPEVARGLRRAGFLPTTGRGSAR